MANLNTNTTDLTNVLNENNDISCSTLECSNKNYDSVNKNHNYFSNNLSYDCSNTNKFSILHPNIRGITNKIDEFIISLPVNAPQVICLTEHHLKIEETGNVNFGQYTLGSAYCRQTFKKGVCVFLFLKIFALMSLI